MVFRALNKLLVVFFILLFMCSVTVISYSIYGEWGGSAGFGPNGQARLDMADCLTEGEYMVSPDYHASSCPLRAPNGDSNPTLCSPSCGWKWVGGGSNENCCGDDDAETWCTNNKEDACQYGTWADCGPDECYDANTGQTTPDPFNSVGVIDNEGCDGESGVCTPDIGTKTNECSGEVVRMVDCDENGGTDHSYWSIDCNLFDHGLQAYDGRRTWDAPYTPVCTGCSMGPSGAGQCYSWDYTCSGGACTAVRMDLDTYGWCDDCPGTRYDLGPTALGQCCGNDANEIVLYKKGPNGDDTTIEACCDEVDDCVWNAGETCIDDKSWLGPTVGSQQQPKNGNYYCNSGRWRDPDAEESYCIEGNKYKWAGTFCCGDDWVDYDTTPYGGDAGQQDNGYLCDVWQNNLNLVYYAEVHQATGNENIGKIITLNYDSYSYLAQVTGSGAVWNKCDAEETVTINNHEFRCTGDQGEWYECCASGECLQDDTSYTNRAPVGGKISDSDGTTNWYCGIDFKWYSSLDQAGKEACNAATNVNSDITEQMYWAGDFCCGSNGQTDYSRASASDQYLCDYNGAWIMHDANLTDKTGRIIHIYKGDYNVVSNGSKWYYCGGDGTINPQVTPFSTFLNVTVGEDMHQFFCHCVDCAGTDTIAECTGDSGLTLAGLTPNPTHSNYAYETGESIAGQTYDTFCTSYFEWTANLDIIDDIAHMPDDNGTTCNKAKNPDGTTANYLWTGTSCCSEHEDGQNEYYNDPYRIGACYNGAGSRNLEYANISYKNNVQFKELIAYNGSWQGCAINHTLAYLLNPRGRENLSWEYKPLKRDPDNDFMLELRNCFDNSCYPDILVSDQPYCLILNRTNIVEGRDSFFCSYSEEWVKTDYMRDHLSHIEWEPQAAQYHNDISTMMRAECCNSSQCWNGTNCVNDQSERTKNQGALYLPFVNTSYRCVGGEWNISPLKFNWDRSDQGYCPHTSQCLVDPNGRSDLNFQPEVYVYDLNNDKKLDRPIDNPNQNMQCIADTQFIGDHYCENGNWTTRTKLVALELFEIAQQESPNQYTLFCEDYDKVLNQDAYMITYFDANTGQPLIKSVSEYFRGQSNVCNYNDIGNTNAPCANKVCVLSYDDTVILGLSLNTDTDGDMEMLRAIGKEVDYCSTVTQTDDNYYQCDDEDVYYNPGLDVMIFSNNDVPVASGRPWETQFQTYLQDPFKYIVDVILSYAPQYAGQQDTKISYKFMHNIKDFEKLYVTKHGTHTVSALSEVIDRRRTIAIYDSTNQQVWNKTLTMKYEGFNFDVCDAIDTYNNNYRGGHYSNPGSGYVTCIKEGEIYYITTKYIPAFYDEPYFNRLWFHLTSELRVTEGKPDQTICSNAHDSNLCDGLDLVYGEGYKEGCCTEYGPLCC